MTVQTLNRFEWAKAVLQIEGLSGTAKALASALAIQFCNDETGQLNPSQEMLSNYLKVHKDTVKRCLRELRNAGWLMSMGDGGRGKAPMLRLLSPSKIVPFRPVKGGQNTPCKAPERGAEMHPQTEKRGGDLQQKGGRNIPPLYNDKQSKEQKTPAFEIFGRTRFIGNAFDGPRPFAKDSWMVLNPWSEWLERNNLPKLCAIPICQTGNEGGLFFVLPCRDAPTTQETHDQAMEYFTTLLEAEGTRYAAQ